ncbi:MAG TPA: ABC transporter substrate-binding protein [Blastocatellia bacterium]|nr:ABC transporter substrate-binding protein [Blastocatellia bacterium]
MRGKNLFIGLFIFLLAFTACQDGRQSGERQTGSRGGRLVVADRSAPQSFSYLAAGDAVTINISFFLMSARLAEFDHDKQQYVPGLAESWPTSDGGKVVTVKLRDGLKFSDGAPMTADDVLFTLGLLADPKLHPPAFYDAMLVDGKPMKASKVDDRTIRLELPHGVAAIEPYLYNVGVLPRHKLEAAYLKGEVDKQWGLAAAPADFAVSGPFAPKEYVAGQRTILKRNEYYWKKDKQGNQLPYLDELVVEAISDPNNSVLKFQQGELDVLDDIRPSDYATMKDKAEGFTVRDLGPRLQTDFFWFNLNDGRDESGKPLVDPAKRAWFADVRFRRAVAHAIDRASIIQNVLRGLGTPLKGVVSPGNKFWVNDNIPAYDYDVKRAQDLLKEAGFRLNDNGLVDSAGHPVEFTLVVSENVAVRKQMATVIQEDLAKLGIKVNVSPVEDKALNELMRKSLRYEAALHGASATDTDPTTISSILRTDGQQRFWFLNQKQARAAWEKKLDQLMDEQSVESDVNKRREKFNEAQRIFAEQIPMIPLVVRHFVSGAKANLGNWRPSFISPRSLWNVDELFRR